MNDSVFSEDLFAFIQDNRLADTAKLSLSIHGKELPFDPVYAIMQIGCRQRCRKKLANFISNPRFLFPCAISAEQASHEAVALYHASLAAGADVVLDMTAGLGIDAMSISKTSGKVIACEIDKEKADILSHNTEVAGIGNMEIVSENSLSWLRRQNDIFDIIFIDPARRSECNARLYDLHDCQPDIISSLDIIMERCKKLIVKASPLLDISKTLSDIPNTTAIRTVSVNGECKEVLVESVRQQDCKHDILMESINLDNAGNIIHRFSFTGKEGSPVIYAEDGDIQTGSWLYEPEASLMKLSPWGVIASRFPSMKKLDVSSHLFVSGCLFSDFPGRILQIDRILRREDMGCLKGERANMAVRNYPLKAEELRKKLKLKEGKDRFIIGTRTGGKAVLIDCHRI